MATSHVNYHSLQPGQWLLFKHKNTGQTCGPFRVINRDNGFMDPCRCFLMGLDGELADYCPRVGSLYGKTIEGIDTFKYNILELGPCDLSQFTSEVCMHTLDNKAIEHIKSLAQGEYMGYTYDPRDPTKRLHTEDVRELYNLSPKE